MMLIQLPWTHLKEASFIKIIVLQNISYEPTCLEKKITSRFAEFFPLSNHLNIAKVKLILRSSWYGIFMCQGTLYVHTEITVRPQTWWHIQVRWSWLRLCSISHKWYWPTELLIFSWDIETTGSSASNGNLIDHLNTPAKSLLLQM